jgi:flagellar biosynthesis/type III secretory pathway M-ring protein FliF/YscJ
MHWNLTNSSVILVVFTVLFILMDEYIAKPIRHRRLQEKAKADPEVRRILEIAAKARADGLIED